MKKYWLISFFVIVITTCGFSQTFITKNGMIRFYSEASLEKIEAVSRQANSALIGQSGDFVFKVLIKSFTFDKALMQEHFNENYLESDKYPEATFVGKVTNIKEVNFAKDGSYPVTVEGKLTIHGQTQLVKETGTFDVKNDVVTAKSKFNILLADYKISIPNTVVNKISKSIETTIEVALTKYK